MTKRLYSGHSDAKQSYFSAHPPIVEARKKSHMEKKCASLNKRHTNNKYVIQEVTTAKNNVINVIKLVEGKKYHKKKSGSK